MVSGCTVEQEAEHPKIPLRKQKLSTFIFVKSGEVCLTLPSVVFQFYFTRILLCR